MATFQEIQEALSKSGTAKIVTKREAVPVVKRGDNSRQVLTNCNCPQLSEEDKKAIATRSIIDSSPYATKYVGGATRIQIFQDDDAKKVGVTNLSGAMLDKGEPFACTGIVIETGNFDGSVEDEADMLKTKFGQAHDYVFNGEVTMKINNGRKVVLDRLPADVFKTHQTISNVLSNNGAVEETFTAAADKSAVSIATAVIGRGRVGYFEFDNPIVIPTGQKIDLDLEWGAALPQGTYMRAKLIGSKVK